MTGVAVIPSDREGRPWFDDRMEFGVLGELVAGAGGDRVSRGQRSRDLLAVLLLRPGRAVSPDVLLDLVWGEEASGLDVSVVHTQVARVRRALGPGAVLTTPTGYRLANPTTDADRFLEHVADARAAEDGAAAVAHLEQGLGLWRGPRPYVDVTDGLAAGETARLCDARLAAEEFLVELLLGRPGREDALRALQLARALIAREPMRERAHELAMLAAARLDEQAEAL
jgi:DNA-binding SARP family transcriptional activator